MTGARQQFYGQSALRSFTRQDILDGRVIKINPALITVTDGLISSTPPGVLQQRVEEQTHHLLAHGIRTFHVDLNFPDYSGFAQSKPDMNTAVFTPDFVEHLNRGVVSAGAFLNVHLLTDAPQQHLREYQHIKLGAICFQLDAVFEPRRLAALVEQIRTMGACPSPVIETVGSERLQPQAVGDVLKLLGPVLPHMGMLTFQAAGTASRSDRPAATLATGLVRPYIESLQREFAGTIQIQGGITTGTVGQAVGLGAEFLVCGTQLFRNPEGLTPDQVIRAMLQAAAETLGASR